MKLQALLVAGLVAAAVAAPAAGHEVVYTTTLYGFNESPANGSPGFGTATVTIDLDLATLNINTSFSGLVGTTTASHIHCCTTLPGTSTAIVATRTPSFLDFPLGVTSGSYDHTYDMQLASSYNAGFVTAHGPQLGDAFAALVLGLDTGKAYLNIHTTAYPGGEIRGFLVAAPVPEPESYVLMLLGLGVLGAVAKRRGAAR